MKGEISQKGKLLLAFAVAGIIFSFATEITSNLLSGALGLDFNQNLQGVTATFFNIESGMAIAFTVIMLAILGVYIWIFGYIGGYAKNKIMGGGMQKLQKRPRIIGLILMGGLVIATFTILDQILAGVDESGNFTSTSGLIEAVTTVNIISVVVRIVAFAILGFLVLWLGTKFQTVTDKAPSFLTKV